MDRIVLSESEMRTLWRTYCLSDAEVLTDRHFPESPFVRTMRANLDLVDSKLEAAGYKVGFQKTDDVFVNYDFSNARVILTELIANEKQTEIEDLLFQTCSMLEGECCICLDIQNHELGKGQRSLVTRTAIYRATEGDPLLISAPLD